MKVSIRFVVFLCCMQFFYSCNNGSKTAVIVSTVSSDLDTFYHNEGKPIGELLACGCLEEKSGQPIFTTIFYPVTDAGQYKLFVTDSLPEDKNDLVEYKEVVIDIDTMFKGKLLRIDQELPVNSIYAKMVEVGEDSIYISDAIKVSAPVLPTEKSSSFVKIDNSEEQLQFNWDTAYLQESKAFLTVISNGEGDIRSCSYTTQSHFKLDDLEDADRVMYPLDTTVNIDNEASLLWMSVNDDNWITRVGKIPFVK